MFDTAKTNSKVPADNPQYFSSGTDAADKASVHGGKTGSDSHENLIINHGVDH
jgi:hypothetical protein